MPFILEAANLSRDPFSGHLTLKLREGLQDIQDEFPHRRFGIKMLGDRDESDLYAVRTTSSSRQSRTYCQDIRSIL